MVAGNVETSQVIVDALYGALGKLAASQGTMNNFTFGDDAVPVLRNDLRRLGRRARLRRRIGRADAHDQFAADRSGSSGKSLPYPGRALRRAARQSAGRGSIAAATARCARIRFRAPMTAAILANRRSTSPFGLMGGGDGKPARNHVRRANGDIVELAATGQAEMAPGDMFVIETPGGGGFGKA